MIKEPERVTVYANALLSDGKILFWYTGSICGVESFYKDFYYAGINMRKYRQEHNLEVEYVKFDIPEKYNNFAFDELATKFYEQFEISPDSKGRKPY